ncbi:hypothetical protein Hdeb2414_s0013g00416721 [Helianthus debilis subsp. tardiflorus]
MSKTPEIYSTAKRKDIYDTLSNGILLQEGKVWFSLGSNGERNEMVSASQFSYENHWSHKWHSLPESRSFYLSLCVCLRLCEYVLYISYS